MILTNESEYRTMNKYQVLFYIYRVFKPEGILRLTGEATFMYREIEKGMGELVKYYILMHFFYIIHLFFLQ